MSLPSLSQISRSPPESEDSALSQTLSILLESSPVLTKHLVPELARSLSIDPTVDSYTSLIDLAIQKIAGSWDTSLQSEFIAGHPRIGQVKNLSALSVAEQARVATPPEVITRLEHLNNCYERKYPGLIYIIFVNGRSRTEVMQEMERVLGVGKLSEGCAVDQPPVGSIEVIQRGSEEWKKELDRAVQDVGLIAKSRLSVFGVR